MSAVVMDCIAYSFLLGSAFLTSNEKYQWLILNYIFLHDVDYWSFIFGWKWKQFYENRSITPVNAQIIRK